MYRINITHKVVEKKDQITFRAKLQVEDVNARSAVSKLLMSSKETLDRIKQSGFKSVILYGQAVSKYYETVLERKNSKAIQKNEEIQLGEDVYKYVFRGYRASIYLTINTSINDHQSFDDLMGVLNKNPNVMDTLWNWTVSKELDQIMERKLLLELVEKNREKAAILLNVDEERLKIVNLFYHCDDASELTDKAYGKTVAFNDIQKSDDNLGMLDIIITKETAPEVSKSDSVTIEWKMI